MAPATTTLFLSIGFAMALLVLGHVATTVAICRRRQPDRMGEYLGRRGCPASRLWAEYRGLGSQNREQRPLCTAKSKAKGLPQKETKLF